MAIPEGIGVGNRVRLVEGDEGYRADLARGMATLVQGGFGRVSMVGAAEGSGRVPGVWVTPEAGGMDQWLSDGCWVERA